MKKVYKMSYIKKEPIIDFIKNGLNNPNKEEAFGYDVIAILTEIEYAPTADVEVVRHARWLDGRCTNCGHEALDYLDETPCGCTMRTYITKYCPNCGAKMDGGKE
jgi:hypothetical protein